MTAMTETARVHADPASQGYSGVVRMGAGVTRSEGKVFCGDSGWAHLICGTSSGQFRFGAPAASPTTQHHAGLPVV